MFSSQLIKIIKPSSGEWSKAAELTSENSIVKTHLYVFVNIKNKIVLDTEILDTQELGVKIINEISGAFFEKETNLNSLQNSLLTIYSNNKNANLIISVSLAATTDNSILLAAVGGGNIALFRDRVLVKILASGPDVISATGQISDSDRFLLTTGQFFEVFDEQQIKRALIYDDESLKKHLTRRGTMLNRANEISLAIIKITKKEDRGYQPESDVINEGGSGFTSRKTKIIDIFKSLKIKKNTEDYELSSKRGKRYSIIGALILIVLIVAANFGVKKKSEEKIRNSYLPILNEAQSKFNQALEVYPEDKTLARSLFLESESLALNLVDKKESDDSVRKLIDDLADKRGEVLGIFNVSTELFLDLNLIVEGFEASQMTLSKNISFIFDKNNKNIIKTNLEDKRSEVVQSIDKSREVNMIASYIDNVYLFSDSIVYGKDWSEIDSGLGGNYIAGSFAGNLYVVDKSANTIWRYTASESGFSDKKSWLNEGNSVNLENATDLAIDGSIWIFTPPQLVVLTSGSQKDFTLLQGYGQTESFYTDEDLEEVYFLNKNDGKILVMTKEEEIIAEYVSDKIKETVDLVVFGEQKRIYLLTDHEILYINFVHQLSGDGGN